MANDELYTPKFIFDQLGCVFDLDVASSDNENIQVPTKSRFTIEDDALVQEWHGLVWMNPPFSKPSPWVDKWLAHGNGVALLPLSGNSQWWQRMWKSEASVIMMRPNIGFLNTEGEEKKIMYGISLWGIGKGKSILQNSGLGHWR